MTALKMDTPPALEQLGALGSLLIHDVANQLCIISGNATFAQMTLTDPQSVRRAVGAISKAGERLSFMLAQLADLRRRLNADLPRGLALECREAVQELFARKPGWTVDIQGGFEGQLCLPTSWVIFALEQALEQIGEQRGRALVRRAQPGEDTAFLAGGNYFQVHLTWNSSTAFSMDEVRHQYQRFGLMAAFVLIRQCGGQLDGFTPAQDRQELLLCVPYLPESDLPNR